jgi:hypothetical protein
LTALGFDKETGCQERRQKRHVASTARALDEQIKDSSLVLFLFGGHGVEYEVFSYLCPLGMGDKIRKDDYAEEAVSVESRSSQGHLCCKIDCCRYNELNNTFKNVKGLGDDGAKG